jgi:hypothetical protein
VELRSKATGSLDDQVNENDGLAMTCPQRWSAVKSSRAEAGRPPGSTASVERSRVADVQVAIVEITGESPSKKMALPKSSPLAISVALAAVEVSAKVVWPALLMKVPEPELDVRRTPCRHPWHCCW